MICRLYKSFDAFEKINKTMTQVSVDINCNLKNDTSLMNPVITLKLPSNIKMTDFNFFFLDFGYYYIVKDIVKKMGGIVEISGEIDVLYSFKTELNNLYVEVIRSESEINKNILDNEVPLITSRVVETQHIGHFDKTNIKTYLCVSGG